MVGEGDYISSLIERNRNNLEDNAPGMESEKHGADTVTRDKKKPKL